MAAAGLLGTALAVVVARRVHRVEVTGPSMLPSLAPGDRLLVVRGLPVREGDVVAVRDPRDDDRVLVKRVEAVWPDGSVDARGDNPGASTDSRDLGPLERRLVVGRVVWRYWPDARRGWL